MKLFCLTIPALLVSISSAHAQLAFQNIQACCGQYGPERTPLHYYHYEKVYFRYLVSGASTDQEGKVNVLTRAELTDPEGNNVGSGEKTSGGVLQFGASFPDLVYFPMPATFKPGEYAVTVTMKDNRTGQVTSFQRKF